MRTWCEWMGAVYVLFRGPDGRHGIPDAMEPCHSLRRLDQHQRLTASAPKSAAMAFRPPNGPPIDRTPFRLSGGEIAWMDIYQYVLKKLEDGQRQFLRRLLHLHDRSMHHVLYSVTGMILTDPLLPSRHPHVTPSHHAPYSVRQVRISVPFGPRESCPSGRCHLRHCLRPYRGLGRRPYSRGGCQSENPIHHSTS